MSEFAALAVCPAQLLVAALQSVTAPTSVKVALFKFTLRTT